MPELLLDVADRLPRLEKEACETVTEVVESNPSKSGTPEEPVAGGAWDLEDESSLKCTCGGILQAADDPCDDEDEDE